MRDKLGSAVWRLAIFVVVCIVGLFALLAIFAQLRFQKENIYQAEFTNVTGLENGNFVRIAGVEVGKVGAVSVHGNVARVSFSLETTQHITTTTRATVNWPRR